MRDLLMIGIALAFTSLLLMLRNVIVGRCEEKVYRVSVMTLDDEDNGGPSPDAAEEWPNIIGAEAEPSAERCSLSDEKHIRLAVMQDSTFRLRR